jgi:DNA recombination protein RmuC
MYDNELSEAEKEEAKKRFKSDLKIRIDETSKYVIEGVTAPYSIMFLTAEAIFAEINAYHPGVIEYAHKQHVYIASPTTLLAVMTTAQVILRDLERSKLAEQIRNNLEELSIEFKRYKERWEKLVTHIKQVTDDVDKINVTTEKISEKFNRIHNADLPAAIAPNLLK